MTCNKCDFNCFNEYFQITFWQFMTHNYTSLCYHSLWTQISFWLGTITSPIYLLISLLQARDKTFKLSLYNLFFGDLIYKFFPIDLYSGSCFLAGFLVKLYAAYPLFFFVTNVTHKYNMRLAVLISLLQSVHIIFFYTFVGANYNVYASKVFTVIF